MRLPSCEAPMSLRFAFGLTLLIVCLAVPDHPANSKAVVNDLKAALSQYKIVVGVLPKDFLTLQAAKHDADVRRVLPGEYSVPRRRNDPNPLMSGSKLG